MSLLIVHISKLSPPCDKGTPAQAASTACVTVTPHTQSQQHRSQTMLTPAGGLFHGLGTCWAGPEPVHLLWSPSCVCFHNKATGGHNIPVIADGIVHNIKDHNGYCGAHFQFYFPYTRKMYLFGPHVNGTSICCDCDTDWGSCLSSHQVISNLGLREGSVAPRLPAYSLVLWDPWWVEECAWRWCWG